MNKITLLITSNHHFWQQVQSLKNDQYHVIEVKQDGSLPELSKFQCATFIDLCLVESEQKQQLLKALSKYKVISELSCYWGEKLMQEHPHIEGALSTGFYSPKKTYEYVALNQNSEQSIQALFQALNIQGLKVKSAGLGFTFPRTLSMIINEAYFALEEKLCSPEDLDTAMKYGVNYPLGPFEWAAKIGEAPVLQLLDELYTVTHDPRYRAAMKLRLKA